METINPCFPPAIPDDNFQVGRLQTGEYCTEDVSAAIVRHLNRRGKNLTERQKEGIRHFKYQGSWNLGQPENLEDLRRYFNIFNDVFFEGLLTGYCTLEIIRDECLRAGFPVGGGCMDYLPGLERDPRFKRERPHAGIYIPFLLEEPTTRIRNYLDVLAHEMLHAMFMVYGCQSGHGGHPNKECHRTRHLPMVSGHDIPWQAAAYAMEQATRPADGNEIKEDGLLMLHLDLRREGSLVCEVMDGGKLPVAAELQRLGLDIRPILRDIDGRKPVSNKWKLFLAKDVCIKKHWTEDSFQQSRGSRRGAWFP